MKTIKNLKADEIRKSILQLAIQGKLVKQDPNDEPASELVKRIYAEKQKLIKEGKLKKDKNESFIFKGDDNCYYEKINNSQTVKMEDLPFDIPDNWTWVRLKNLVTIQTGKKDANFGSSDGIYNFFTCALIPIKCKTFSYDGEYILLPGNGANVGQSVHYFGKFEAYQRTYLINKIFEQFSFYYLKLVLDCSWKKWNEDKLFGSAIPYIKLPNLEEFLVPLPPLNEETKIYEKINEIEPLLKDYELAESKLSVLELEFPEKLKKSILQYAIEGKLVKQDPNDEPASVLLERIKTEKEKLIKEGKIKRDKNESIIYQGDDKNYYENLPLGWSICTLNDVAIYKKGPFGSSLTKEMFVPEFMPNRIKVYEQKNAIQHNENLGNYYISQQKYNEMQSFKANELDFIVSCAGTIGEVFKLPYGSPVGIINQALMKVTLFDEEISDYFEIVFYDVLHKLSEKSKGTAIKNIPPFEILKPATIMIPPLQEQKRILKSLNYINSLLDY